MKLTIAIPLYNEELVFNDLVQRLDEVVNKLDDHTVKILLIDDGSSDKTPILIEEKVNLDQKYSAIILSRNFGHQAALSAAVENVNCDCLVIMDGDLQDPPEIILDFVEKYEQGYDVVYAYKETRKANFIFKYAYFIFYRSFNYFAEYPIALDSGDFVLLSKRAISHLANMSERNKFYRGLRSWIGFNQIGIPYNRPERVKGVSKYSLKKLIELASMGIFSFSTLPLRFAFFTGMLAIVFSILFSLYTLYHKFLGSSNPTGFTAIVILVSFLSGTQLVFLGVIGEYIGRIFDEVKNRPTYIIKDRFNS